MSYCMLQTLNLRCLEYRFHWTAEQFIVVLTNYGQNWQSATKEEHQLQMFLVNNF